MNDPRQLKPSYEVDCITDDVQGFKIVFANDLQNPTVLNAYEDDMSLLVHDLDEARAVAGFCAWRTGLANEIRFYPYVDQCSTVLRTVSRPALTDCRTIAFGVVGGCTELTARRALIRGLRPKTRRSRVPADSIGFFCQSR